MISNLGYGGLASAVGGAKSWTPTIGEWNSSTNTLSGLGYTGSSTESWYSTDGKMCTAKAYFPGVTGVTSPNLGAWQIQLPVTPANWASYRPIGRADFITYFNRGFDATMELHYEAGANYPLAKFLLRKSLSEPFAALAILSNSNWTSWVPNFFGTYADIMIMLEYEVA